MRNGVAKGLNVIPRRNFASTEYPTPNIPNPRTDVLPTPWICLSAWLVFSLLGLR